MAMRSHVAINLALKDKIQALVRAQKKKHGKRAKFPTMKSFVDQAVTELLQKSV